MADAAISALFDGAQVPPTKDLGFCISCDATFPRGNGNRKYCEECKRERDRERDRKRRPAKGVLGKPFICGHCGGEFPTKRGGQKYCDGCRYAAVSAQQREKRKEERKAAGLVVLGEEIVCIDCGVKFNRRAAMHYRCDICVEAHTKRYMDEYHEKTRPKKKKTPKKVKPRVIGVVFSCIDCGVDVVKRGALHKRCDECNKALVRKKDAETKRRLRADPEIREKLNAKARAKPRTDALRAYVRKWEKKKRANDPKFVINSRMHAMVSNALRGKKAGRSWQALVGYTVDELMVHLERQFLRGMTWENRSEWQVDHIVPVASFNFADPDDADFKACWALTNLRPLWKKQNRDKWHHRVYLI